MRVDVLALDGVFDTGLSAVADTFTTASELSGATPPPFALRIVGMRGRVRTALGAALPTTRPGRPRPDVVIVPALGAKAPEALAAALGRRDVVEACALLRRLSAAGTLVCAACTSSFVLAQAGLLDGRAASTSWWLAPLFRQRFPQVDLDESRMVVDSGNVITAGAALAHFDLALWLVRRQSPALASLTARYLLFDARPSQSAYIIPDHLAHSDPIVERFETWARRQIAGPFSLAAAARAARASERTLSRRVQQVLGKSPLSYVQDLRVEQAIHLLRTTPSSVEEIAERVGYGDGTTLRNLLRRKTGRGVRELRATGV